MICLSLYGSTDEICDAILASTDADLYEVRLDLSRELVLERIRAATSQPLIFTAHQKPDQLKVAEPFADYLDVEQSPIFGKDPIVSIHAADSDPAQLWQRLHGSHITKIVLETNDYSRILALLEFNRKGRALCFASGEVGAFSRVLSLFWGAPWIYSCLAGRATGNGQLAIDELIHTYHIRRHSESPHVFGILGNPVAHSRSPAFHNRRFMEAGLPWIYLPFPCTDLGSFMDHAQKFGVEGFSVTHPHKESILSFLTHRSNDVAKLRSCNTVCRKPDGWHGTNTDIDGLKQLIEEYGVRIADERIVIIGAGGSARTILSVVKPIAREVIILNRTKSKADALAAEYQARSAALTDLSSLKYEVLFQATPVGLKQDECPIDPSHLRANTTVIDLIYEPSKTLLLQKAESIGCRAINGESWFEGQAEAQFQWWHSMLAMK